jgi:hypothetical protein
MHTLPGMKQLSKEEIEKCLLLWGCVPYDTDWVRDCDLFIKPISKGDGVLSESELFRKEQIKKVMRDAGIQYFS